MKVKIKKLNDKAILPQWNNKSAGCDLSSTEEFILLPGERHLFKTGLSMAIPSGLYGRVAPRSGLAYKSGIDVLAGVIDEDYRGEIGVILINLGKEPKYILVGDKIAQLIFEPAIRTLFVETDVLDDTDRGSGGYGSTDFPKHRVTNEVKPTEPVKGFVLGKQTKIEKSVPQHLRSMATVQLIKFDGDIYEFTEGTHVGVCVVDSSGQVLSKYYW